MDEETHTNPLLERANVVLADGDSKYAMFLYREALKKEPENTEIRAALHKLRRSIRENTRSIFSLIKQWYLQMKILYQKRHNVPACTMIDTIESWLDYDPNNFVGYRMIAQTALEAKMYILADFSINEIPEENRIREDLLILARAAMEQKKFDQSLKIANSILESDPDDPEAKDIVWKSSVDKHMSPKVELVMADGIKRMAPPHVDAAQIVMTNPKTDDKNKKEEKDGGEKGKRSGGSEK